MNLLNRMATLAVLALFGAAPGDRPAAPGRLFAGPAAALRQAGALPGPFTVFGWVSPPASITTDARIAELAGAGMNLAMTAWNDSGRLADNLRRLDLAAAQGMRCLIWDARFDRFDVLDPDSPEGGALLDTIVADYRGHPGFFGFALGDEPPRTIWPLLARIYAGLRQRDPGHPVWNNLLGPGAFPDRASWERYVTDYLEQVRPGILCDDHYEFLISGNRGQFVENAASLNAWAREAGLPFWSIVLLVQHGLNRGITPGELTWQISMLLAYGARGIGYFAYWTPAPDTVWNWKPAIITYEGERTAWYPFVAALNQRARPAGETLAGLTWLGTEHAGSTPVGGTPFAPDGLISAVEGRAALGHFVDGSGTRHVLLVNSDSLAARTVGLSVNGVRRIWRLGESVGDWQELSPTPALRGERLDVALGPGDFVLLRFGGGFAPFGVGAGPRLAVWPRPAHREVNLTVSGLSPGGHVEVLDLGGRRVRSWRPGTSETTLSWCGERDSGGFAPPGLYFVRAEDSGGVSVSRIEWLGRR